MTDNNSAESKQIAVIENTLEGSWILDTYTKDENQQILTFIIPEKSGEWSILQQRTSPIDDEFISLQYRITLPTIDIAKMEVRVNENTKVLKYNIDILSSGLKVLYLTDEYGIKSNYRYVPQSQ